MNITYGRQNELMDLATHVIENQDHWNLGNWDGWIEDGELTEEEWEWLRDNCTVLVEVVRNEDLA